MRQQQQQQQQRQQQQQQQPQQPQQRPAWFSKEPSIIRLVFAVLLYLTLRRSKLFVEFLQRLRASCKNWLYNVASTTIRSRNNSVSERELLQEHDFSSSSSSSLSFHSTSSSSEIGSDPEYDDLLASVSLLFQEQEEQEYSYYNKHDSGTIIARILAKEDIEYEKTKPAKHLRLDPLELSSLITDDISKAFEEIESFQENNFFMPEGYSDPSDLMVVLEVHLNLTTFPEAMVNGPGSIETSREEKIHGQSQRLVARQHHIYMRLHRKASESTKRMLRRLQVSAARKISSQILELETSMHCNTKYIPRQSPQTSKLENEKFAIAPNTLEPSFWVIETPITELSQNNKDSSEDSRPLLWQRSSSQRQIHLTKSPPFASAPRNDMQSFELWKELAGYNKGRLYLDLRQDGPLLALDVDACPPTLLRINTFEDFRTRVYVGVPLVVEVTLLHATNVTMAWFVQQEGSNHHCRGVYHVPPGSPPRSSYTPSVGDLGKTISVLIVPMRPGHKGEGCEEAYKFEYPVEHRPPLPIVRPLRESWTADRKGSSCLRVLSYNLLADWYAGRHCSAEKAYDSEDESTTYFYNHCKGEYLKRNRRFPLLIYEILSYHPDLVCLQEVDCSVYDRLLRPALEANNYQGYYSNKATEQAEGCAIFWSLQYFQKQEEECNMHHFYLRDLLSKTSDNNNHGTTNESNVEAAAASAWKQSMKPIHQLLDGNADLRQVVTSKVGQVVQVAKLELRRDDRDDNIRKPRYLVVGNTHLFYHPLADHIRLIQAAQVCKQMDIVRQSSQDDCASDGNCPIVLCGDLNSNPLSGAVHLLLQGRIGPDHTEAWKNLDEYSWEMGGEDYLVEHGYIGNENALDEDEDPCFVNEAFEDANEDIFDDALGGVGMSSSSTLSPLNHSANAIQDSEMTHDAFKKTIAFPSSFPRLMSGYPQIPEFTNFSIGFDETLDYIFASESSPSEEYGLEPSDAAPLPTKQDMHQYGAMPNAFMPSDHLSLLCDLKWKHY